MKTKFTIALLCVALLGSVVSNMILARANLAYVDKSYGSLAEQHLVYSRVRAYLEESRIEAAKAILDKEIESKGSVLAICLMESCSRRAKEIMDARPQH